MGLENPDPLLETLQDSIATLLKQLTALGVPCKGIALLDGEGHALLPFADAGTPLTEAIGQLFARVLAERQLSIARDGAAGFLLAYPLPGGEGKLAHVFMVWLEAVSEQNVAQLRLAMGWLHLPFLQGAAERGDDALYLLDMQANVFSQRKARAGAQEWVNRIAQLLRHDRDEASCSVAYFRMLDPGVAVPRWWVTSDTASAESGTAALHAATDVATRAALEFRELTLADAWAFPVIDEGEIVGVLVVSGAAPAPRALALVRASASVVGPLLGHWRLSEQGLGAHVWAATREGMRKLREPGFLTWKLGAVCVLASLGLVLLIPFDDHAVAKVVVEGHSQQVISAPFEGYWAEVKVRPGDPVKEGQLIARLDTRDLKVEQEKLRSERDQASGKLRQALSEGDSATVQQVSAQLRQSEAQLALVEAKLQRAEIRAPADGAILTGDWYDQIGSPVEAGKKLFEIAAGKGYRVVLQVPEEEIARVALSQTGEIRVTGLPQTRFAFRVNRVTAVAALDDHKNTFRVEARLDDANAPLRPGMQGVGKIVVARSNLLTIAMRPLAQWARMKLWAMWG
ncbi:efflux RND transporter periplasmic adaptor subunit [Niveibacterium terrae]|uniref:efflux RND transporter periplasmic adaptor subunit n=1 Tax=Niveibacterium terrae TaxID=3373598 RepID=UPI003A909EEF